MRSIPRIWKISAFIPNHSHVARNVSCLGTQPGFGTQPLYEAPGDLWVEYVKMQVIKIGQEKLKLTSMRNMPRIYLICIARYYCCWGLVSTVIWGRCAESRK